MKRFGMRTGIRYGGAAGILAVAGVAVALAASTAEAGPNKPYTANVHQKQNDPTKMVLTVNNDPQASQTLGSANFTPPAGLTVTGVVSWTLPDTWTVSKDSAGIVEFRANSSATALGKGGTISATVSVSKTALCAANPPANNSGTWGIEAKQSNSFSGTPGNDLQLGSPSDLTPLGRFVFAPVESGPPTYPIEVPQIVTGSAAPISIQALDTCGNPDLDYSGATLNKEQGFGLANAAFSALTWATTSGSRVGSATLTPVDVEVNNQFTVNDAATGISAASSSTNGRPTFDVVETICAIPGTTCVWTDKHNPGVSASSTVPNGNNGQALGLGYQAFASGDLCALKPPLGDSIQIDPYQYPGPFWIYLTYAKSIVPNGSGFLGCKFDDNAQTWTALPACGKVPAPPCYVTSNLPGGKLQIGFYLDPADPRGGGF